MGDTQWVYQIKNSSGLVVHSWVYNAWKNQYIAFVNSFSGDVAVNNIPLSWQNTTISLNDTIETWIDGSVEIIFRDHSVFRLNTNTRISIGSWNNGNIIYVKNGDIWGRVLTPFTDATFFTLESSDVSAGVRGTSFVFRVNENSTEITVVDTTSSGANTLSGIIWTLSGWLAQSGILNQEEIGVFMIESATGQVKKISLKNLFEKDTFARENTSKDLIYLAKLLENINSEDTPDIYEKILAELQVSIPGAWEESLFSIDPTLAEDIKNILKKEWDIEAPIEEREVKKQVQKVNDPTKVSEPKTPVYTSGEIIKRVSGE
jgi:hypothetical protein